METKIGSLDKFHPAEVCASISKREGFFVIARTYHGVYSVA